MNLRIAIEDPESADAAVLLEELSSALAAITGSSGKASFDASDVRGQQARFVVARDAHGTPVGCGGFRPLGAGVAEIKRMYSRRAVPGVGTAVLHFLEAEAQKLSYDALRLETRIINSRAMAFYERLGYSRIPNFGKYAGRTEAACFEKKLSRD